MHLDLGALADPANFTEPLDLHQTDRGTLLRHLEGMVTIRTVEEVIADMVVGGQVKCPCHLAIGQEAIAVGIADNLRSDDRAYGNHRSHGHYIAAGGDLRALFAEILGRADGCSHGMGGSMHLFAEGTFFQGSVPIVAGTVPVAVGAALACKKDGRGGVGVAFFGDGACEEGVVHESMNMAAVMQLPMLFVIENNLFSSHMDMHLRQRGNRTARYGEAHGMDVRVIDGNDVLEVARVSGELIGQAREMNRPAVLECVTYRWRGHVGPNEDVDVGLRRSSDELSAWKRRDPVRRLAGALVSRGDVSETDVEAINRRVRDSVADARAMALESAWPKPDALINLVYGDA